MKNRLPLWHLYMLRTFETAEEAAARIEAERPAAEAEKNKPKTFTQEQVNEMIARRVGEVKAEVTKLADSLKMTEEQKKDFENRLNNTVKEKQGEVETLKASMATLQQRYDSETQQLKGEQKAWEERFKQTLVTTELSIAAGKHQAIDAMDIIKLAKEDIQVTPEVGADQKPNGKFKVQVQSIGEGGKPVLLSPEDFMVQLKAKKPNLFAGARGGAGTMNSGAGTSTGDLRTLTKEEKKAKFKEELKTGK